MTSARSITRSVRPPRAVFVDFPLGHTAGRPEDAAGNRAILRDVLAAFESIDRPGAIVDLSYSWEQDDRWKERLAAPGAATSDARAGSGADDERGARNAEPQYQCEADRLAAEARSDCPTCVFLEPA